jgi:hypothetical protein
MTAAANCPGSNFKAPLHVCAVNHEHTLHTVLARFLWAQAHDCASFKFTRTPVFRWLQCSLLGTVRSKAVVRTLRPRAPLDSRSLAPSTCCRSNPQSAPARAVEIRESPDGACHARPALRYGQNSSASSGTLFTRNQSASLIAFPNIKFDRTESSNLEYVSKGKNVKENQLLCSSMCCDLIIVVTII